VTAFFAWWDGVEEWLTGLSFVPQLLVTVAVVIPVAILIAYVLSLMVDLAATLFDRRRFADDDGTGL
jgi:flagellar biosynthesis protein FliQ